MMRSPSAIPLLFALAACHAAAPASQTASPAPEGYRSDYFVFLSADPADPLIVPVDINWEPRPGEGLFTELKAWRGTAEPWRMAYHTGTQPLAGRPYPRSFAEVPATAGFSFSTELLALRSKELGEISLRIPPEKEGATFQEERAEGKEVLTAYRTTVTLDGRAIPGWLIHERFEVQRLVKTPDAAVDFERFHWIPLVAEGGLYLFRSDREGQLAVRWREEDGRLGASSLAAFTFREERQAPDPQSGRAQVPVAWTIEAADWGLRAELASGAGHTGYGPQRKSGKALYRQALVQGKDGQGKPLHGMVELILED
jgi:hypothetical protein